jgi:hypothetical protein
MLGVVPSPHECVHTPNTSERSWMTVSGSSEDGMRSTDGCHVCGGRQKQNQCGYKCPNEVLDYYTASPRSLEAMRQTFIWGDTDNGPGLFPLLRLPISLNCCTHRRMLSGRGFALNCSEIPLNTPFLPPTTHTQPSGARTPFLEQRPWPPRYLRRRSVWRMRICMHARYI